MSKVGEFIEAFHDEIEVRFVAMEAFIRRVRRIVEALR